MFVIKREQQLLESSRQHIVEQPYKIQRSTANRHLGTGKVSKPTKNNISDY